MNQSYSSRTDQPCACFTPTMRMRPFLVIIGVAFLRLSQCWLQRSTALHCAPFNKKEDGIVGNPLLSDEVNDFVSAIVTDGSVVGSTPPPSDNMAIIFLQQELRLSESTLINVILKHSSLMYLRVESNLRPTIEVFRSFGFKDKDIRSMVEQTPSVLAINHEWTLPEKLISLQSMFNLNKVNLVKVVVSQPFLLTSSIERNLEISKVTQPISLQ